MAVLGRSRSGAPPLIKSWIRPCLKGSKILRELATIKFSKPSKVVPVYRVGHTQTPLCKYSNIAYESEQVVAVLYPTDLVTC